MVGVLHTWTRNLFYHPHVHYLVPGGGVGSNGLQWLPARKDFFLPVKALSKLFRAAFQCALRRTALYTQIPQKVWRRAWVVHCKSVGNGQAALKYLAPYIHRVAISNRRLLSIDHRGSLETSQVTFQYRPSDTGQLKTCTLSVEHFIQRFLQHVLPRGFVKIRYFGFFAATLRSRLAALQQSLLPQAEPPTDQTGQPTIPPTTSWQDNMRCPKCGQPMLVLSLVDGLFQRILCPLACGSP
jgi:hypothetical protein